MEEIEEELASSPYFLFQFFVGFTFRVSDFQFSETTYFVKPKTNIYHPVYHRFSIA